MSRRTLLLLALAGLVLVGLVVLDRVSRPAQPGVGDLLLPALRGQVEQISVIAVIGPGEDATTTLELRGREWVVAEHDDWPADMDRLSTLMRALVAARRIEQMTSNPERYARLSVDDPREGGRGVAVELSHNGDVTTVIVGETRVQGGDYSYVRIAGEDSAWLVDVVPSAPASSDEWLDRRLFDLPETGLVSLAITHADDGIGDVRLKRDEDDAWTLEPPPTRALLHDRMLANTAGALDGLRFERVVESPDAPEGPPHVVDAVTRDGEAWRLELWRDGDSHRLRARGSAAGANDAPARAARLEGRTFEIAAHRYRQLTRSRDDLLEHGDD